MTESVVVLSRHTEVCSVAACLKWCSKLKSPCVLLIRVNNSINWLRGSTNFITVCLDKQSILRPLILSIISESPRLFKCLTSLHNIFVTKVLFNEASKVLLWSRFSRTLLRFRLRLVLLRLRVVLRVIVFVLTNDLHWSLFREAYL